MSRITNFSVWLNQTQLDDHEDVYDLYKAIEGAEEVGLYKCTALADQTRWLVRAKCVEDTLMLVSIEARSAFLREIERRSTGGEMDIESWYGYMCAMSKDD
ncbi:hypothetical protein [Xanthomonas pisi]|uniref:Uncharacterized protein n=1 Tax=Xanthomonas pisi TaxID=56457 RepID=A0A2S7CY27_9XANT|nr:hypothetical protein [Xanthomonas pisi]KLD71237.1 hypothetical protein Y887_07450 [Xanthomonas pisi DSM 18956]PPU66461.1 hypothetical protein XpiCFBP4643_19055 [Xanthomonas pisi]